MTVLEATVEIAKAAIIESKTGSTVLMNADERAKFLEGITALHEKLRQLEMSDVRYRD